MPVETEHEIDDRIRRLHADGVDYVDMAVRLGLPRYFVLERLAAMGLKSR